MMCGMTRPAAPFGTVLTAMVTPFRVDGSLDIDGAATLAEHLVGLGNDGLVVNGTTGEAPTTTDDEKDRLVRAVVEAVGDRAHVVAGVGTNDTAHTCELARQAEKAGARALLVVTPYYSKPPQEGLLHHFRTVADATGLPSMLYDIPARTAAPIKTETLLRLAEHDRIVAVKDAKDDLTASAYVIANTDLAFYSGTDALNLPSLAVGASGFVSVVSHLFAGRLRELAEAFFAGDVVKARDINAELLPAYAGFFRTQGVITVKAALAMLDLPAGPTRPPLVDATDEQRALLRKDLADAGMPLP
jgi:4-hydroxy-tetrahydrodipicolinate synthase